MNEQHDSEQLRRRMAEASLLAADDPQRIALEAELAGRDQQLQQQWRELGTEAVQLRAALSAVAPLRGLEERLLAAKEKQVVRWRRKRASLAAAGCVAAACIAAIVAWRGLLSGDTAAEPTPSPPRIEVIQAQPGGPQPPREPPRLLTQRDFQIEFSKSPERLHQWLNEPAPISVGGGEVVRAHPWSWDDTRWLQ